MKEDNNGPNGSLFLIWSTWIIALVVDTSDVPYLCDAPQVQKADRRGREPCSHLHLKPEQGRPAIAQALYGAQPIKILQRG